MVFATSSEDHAASATDEEQADTDATPVSFLSVVFAGAIIGWVGGILVGTAEAALILTRVLLHVPASALPLWMWAGEAGRIILTHALFWTMVLTLIAVPWAALSRWRSRKHQMAHGAPFLAAIGVFVVGIAMPMTQILGRVQYEHWMLFLLAGISFLAAAATYAIHRWIGGHVGRKGLWRLYRIAACLGLGLVAPLAVAMAFSPALGPAAYHLPAYDGPPAPSVQNRPNILWIVLDTVRADRLSLYGYSESTTPFLDKFAEDSVVYKQAVANGIWTVPSHASMFTGLSVTQHGAMHGDLSLKRGLLTIAELLRDHGYATALFGNNPHVSSAFRFSQGFEYDPTICHLQKLELVSPSVWGQFAGLSPLVPWLDADSCTAYTGVFLTRWLDKLRPADRPWFAFVNYVDVHLPILVPKPYRRMFLDEADVRRSYDLRFRVYGGPIGIEFPLRYNFFGSDDVEARDVEVLRGQYDAALRYLDDRLAELMHALEQRGMLDNTYVIITSDHGDSHGEHEVWSHVFCVYDTLTRVPLIVRHPGGAVSANVPTPVQLSDLYATVAKWAGVPSGRLPPTCSPPLPERVEPSALQRYAVAEWLAPPPPMLQDAERRDPDVDLNPFRHELRALIDSRYKFIWSSSGNHELYDLIADPEERANIIATSRSTAARLEVRLNDWLANERANMPSAAEGPPVEGEGAPITEDLKEQLRNLGYVR